MPLEELKRVLPPPARPLDAGTPGLWTRRIGTRLGGSPPTLLGHPEGSPDDWKVVVAEGHAPYVAHFDETMTSFLKGVLSRRLVCDLLSGLLRRGHAGCDGGRRRARHPGGRRTDGRIQRDDSHGGEAPPAVCYAIDRAARV